MGTSRYVASYVGFYFGDPSEQYDLMAWLNNLGFYDVSAEANAGVSFFIGRGEYTTAYPTGVWVAPDISRYPLTEQQFEALSGPVPEWPTT